MGKMRFLRIYGIGKRIYAILMAVLARQNRSTTWSANRVCDKAVVETHSFASDSVNLRCLVDLAPVGADRVRSMIIGHDQKNVGRLRPRLREGGRQCRVEKLATGHSLSLSL